MFMFLNDSLEKNIVVIGGGIAGIISALLIRKKQPNASIFLFESSEELGGNLNGFHYKKKGIYFDKGTHIFQESGDTEIDDLIKNSIPSEKLILFGRGKGDFVGSIHENQFNEDSHYPNIERYHNLRNSVLTHLESSKPIEIDLDYSKSLKSEVEKRFGVKYAKYLDHIFKNLYKHDLQYLSSCYLKFVGLNRLIIGKNKNSSNYYLDNYFNNFIGFPNQFNVPIKQLHSRRSYYSNSEGTLQFIDGLVHELIKSKISIIKNTKVKGVNLYQKGIMIEKDEQITIFKYEKLLITSGVFSAANLLNLENKIPRLPSLETTFFNVKLKKNTQTKVFYLYNYDSDLNFYRVTNYNAFSGKKNDKRITIECHNLKEKNLDYLKKILQHLKNLNVLIDSEFEKVFIENKKYGLPIISKDHYKDISNLKSHLDDSLDKSIFITGLGMGKNFNFFQNEILLDCKSKINEMIQ